jgi:predicted ribosomally synthesized peptide with nif11-like leader
MSKVKEFYEALSKDEAMQERAKGLKAAGETTAEAEAVVAFAKAEGYAFTAGELQDYGKELSDEKLAAVAGGGIDDCRSTAVTDVCGGPALKTRMKNEPCDLIGMNDDGTIRSACPYGLGIV